VDPPLWRTPAFLASACAALAAGVVLLHRLRVRSRVRHALEVARAREEAREDLRRRAASDFHDELGHRLARIGLFSELAVRPSSKIPEDVQAALERIGEEARRLADDARDFLGVIGGEPGTLADLVARLSRFGEQLFERTEVEFRCEGAFESFDAIRVPAEDRRNLLSIFKEAMTNSLKHSRCRHVTLRVAVLDDAFTIALEDDGCGFVRTTAASGQGLRNMEWRAQRIAGTIRIASSPGGGTTVALTRRLNAAAQE
jgi:signal transduction histidine kinase